MAELWIKIRQNLPDDPTIIGVAERLGVKENQILGACLRIWIWADRHTPAGFGKGITPKWIDAMAQQKGIANELVNEKWLLFSDKGMQLVNFEKHNGESAKRRATDSERKRQDRSGPKPVQELSENCPEPVRELSVQNGDQIRVDKSRVENTKGIKTAAASPPPFPVELDTPDFRDAWERWQKHRKEARKPLTPSSIAQQLKKLTAMGPVAAAAAIDHSIANSYQGIYPENKGNTNGRAYSSLADQRRGQKLSGEFCTPIELPIDDYSACVGVPPASKPPVLGLSRPTR